MAYNTDTPYYQYPAQSRYTMPNQYQQTPYQPMTYTAQMPYMSCAPQGAYQQASIREPVPQAQQGDPGGIIWVMGEAGAKAYLVAPGCTVQLWDRESNVIYLKSADMSGVPSMRILDYTERGAATQTSIVMGDTSQYVTREELESILDERFKQSAKGDIENGKSTVSSTKKQQAAPQ